MTRRSANLVICLTLLFAASHLSAAPPRNIIILIGDGMGFQQVDAAGMYMYGYDYGLSPAHLLPFQLLPYQGELTTYSASSSITDSAAAGTSLATGFKVNNGVVAMAYPSNASYPYGSEILTLLEHFKTVSKSTGLVTTTYISHATPASFGAHEPARGNYSQIVSDYLIQTQPTVLLGGAKYINSATATSAGYTVVTTNSQLGAPSTLSAAMLSGQFGSDHMPYEYDGDYNSLPHLSEMAAVALNILEDDPDGFFLMIEGGRIDHAGHDNAIERNVRETVEFANTVQTVLDWCAGWDDTLIIVTADHETGGLGIIANNGALAFPSVTWSTDGHTGVNVPIYAWGHNAEMVSGVMDNTDIFEIATANLLVGDLNGDGTVNIVDLNMVLIDWGKTGGLTDPRSDANSDGTVDIVDLNFVLIDWGL